MLIIYLTRFQWLELSHKVSRITLIFIIVTQYHFLHRKHAFFIFPLFSRTRGFSICINRENTRAVRSDSSLIEFFIHDIRYFRPMNNTWKYYPQRLQKNSHKSSMIPSLDRTLSYQRYYLTLPSSYSCITILITLDCNHYLEDFDLNVRIHTWKYWHRKMLESQLHHINITMLYFQVSRYPLIHLSPDLSFHNSIASVSKWILFFNKMDLFP